MTLKYIISITLILIKEYSLSGTNSSPDSSSTGKQILAGGGLSVYHLQIILVDITHKLTSVMAFVAEQNGRDLYS